MAALRTTSIFLIEMILFFGAYYFGKLKHSISGSGGGGEGGEGENLNANFLTLVVNNDVSLTLIV